MRTGKDGKRRRMPRRQSEPDEEDSDPPETPEERRERLERGRRWNEAATRAWIKDHPGHTAADYEHWGSCAATDEQEEHWLEWFAGFSAEFHKHEAMPTDPEVPHEATPCLIVTIPKKDYTAAALKQNRRFANALAYVRGIVLDKKLTAQLEPYADALDIIYDTLPRITGNKTFDGPCAFYEAIEKAMRRDKKLRDAIKLTGWGQQS